MAGRGLDVGTVAMLLLSAASIMLAGCSETKGNGVKLTLTISGSILRSGGTVILFPKEVAAKDGCPERIGVDLTEAFSFVEFDYCDTWTVRFEPAVGADRSASTRFKPLTHGSGEYNDEHGEHVKVEEYQVFHITGPQTSEKVSYSRGIFYSDYLAKGTECKTFGDHAKVCVPKVKSLDHPQ